MDFECHKCKKENLDNPACFGDDAICAFCGAIHETEWEYINNDNIATWVVGLKEGGKLDVP